MAVPGSSERRIPHLVGVFRGARVSTLAGFRPRFNLGGSARAFRRRHVNCGSCDRARIRRKLASRCCRPCRRPCRRPPSLRAGGRLRSRVVRLRRPRRPPRHQFRVPKGSMRILLGASGAGKSVVLKLILGLAPARLGHDSRQRPAHRSTWPSAISCGCRADIGMLFQENALFDSLTVAENVGYRLYEETDMPRPEVRTARRRGARVHRSRRIHRPDALGAVRRSAAPRRDRPRDGRQAEPAAVRRSDDRARSHHRHTVDDEIVKLRDLEHVTSIVVTHQIRDAFYVATHEASRDNGALRIVAVPEAEATHARFMVLHDGRIYFEGTAAELRASRDALPAGVSLHDATALVARARHRRSELRRRPLAVLMRSCRP